ncbi:MAG: electron transfer flavoprotein-ubiquinone oxidoreductase [Micropepsaceae bacterium]
MMPVERESMVFDVVIVGAGPAGLSAAIRLKQLGAKTGREISVCVLEKGSEVGAHVLSGAVIDPVALNELFSDWQSRQAPLTTAVNADRFYYLSEQRSRRIPAILLPPSMKNHGNYIVSLGLLCRWLAREAEKLGVEIFPGFAAVDFVEENGEIRGVVTGDMGTAKDGEKKPGFTPGIMLLGKYTLIAEGARGSLAKRLIARFDLSRGRAPQTFGLGLKELWELPQAAHQSGLVFHSLGWPLDNRTGGGAFVYHYGDNLASVGFVVHLDYENPYLSPYDEFQRFKTHPIIRSMLQGGRRIAYGARTITEGGLQAVPRLVFPGGALIGCAAGFVNVPRIKGTHNAMKTGMLAAESVVDALETDRSHDVLEKFENDYRRSWVFRDLYSARNVKPLLKRHGTLAGSALGGFDLWCHAIFGRGPFGTLRSDIPDFARTKKADKGQMIVYPPPDGLVSFDKMSSVYLAGTSHDEDQPTHLKLNDPDLPIRENLPKYAEPAQRYCPAGVFEVLEEGESARFVINAANCVHCKACDIKDPGQNIAWTPPEGGSGPNYAAM